MPSDRNTTEETHDSEGSTVAPLRCRLWSHKWKYTPEYENDEGHIQADRFCIYCNERELAWTGPRADEMRALGFEVPTEVALD